MLFYLECEFPEFIAKCLREHVELLKQGKNYLQIDVDQILEDIFIICESFCTVSFVSVLLRCNRVILVLASAPKENENIVWLEKCPLFLSHCYSLY